MTVLGKYEPWGRLGGGGMSDVWLARHAGLATPVVVKTLRPELAVQIADADGVMRSTARLMARLCDPNVVRVLDVGRDAVGSAISTPCLVEEYVDGLDLGELDLLRRTALRRPLPLWAVADVVAQAARGLHAAHQVGVVHRDVKPANLFADAALRIRVGDFGIAIAPREQRASAPAGTPLFMAPEQLLSRCTDRTADVFSLGATAYALRYGAPPWADSGALVRGESDAAFPAPRSAEEAYFQHLVRSAMAHDPKDRPRTAHHLEHGLRSLADGHRPRLALSRHAPGAFAVGPMRVTVEVGDLSCASADAIINSAYSELRMDQGVGLALKRRGGAVIEHQAMAGGAQPLGACIETSAGALSCRSVLHAVGAWNEVSCVARALLRALWIAEARGYRSIALPAIGTGRGKVSLASSADTIATSLRTHAALGGGLREVRVVVYDEAAASTFEEIFAGVFLRAEPEPDDDHAEPIACASTVHAPTLVA